METQENYIEMHLIVKNVGQSTMQGLTIVSGINRNLDISHKITLLLFVCNRIADQTDLLERNDVVNQFQVQMHLISRCICRLV